MQALAQVPTQAQAQALTKTKVRVRAETRLQSYATQKRFHILSVNGVVLLQGHVLNNNVGVFESPIHGLLRISNRKSSGYFSYDTNFNITITYF